MKRVTLRDIARASGVHLATVSRALRGDPQIGGKTASDVRRIAEQMGYTPDPMLTALSAYRSQIRKQEYHATIAWLSNSFTRQGWNQHPTFRLYYEGVCQRAALLGYQIEEFWLREPGITPKRATSILRSRGITGLILAPQPQPKMRVRLGWEHFSAVALSYTIAWPQLHVVTNDQFQSMVSTLRHLRAHGYRRIALAVEHSNDARSDHRWTGAFLSQSQYWAAQHRIPVVAMECMNKDKFDKWVQKHRPEAIISYTTMARRLQDLGYELPADMGFATYARIPEKENLYIAGIDENALLIGAAAVDLVVGMLHRGERGIPDVRQCLLVEGTWSDGTTLTYKNRSTVLTGVT